MTIKRSSVKKTYREKWNIIHKELTGFRCPSVKRREKASYRLLNPLKIYNFQLLWKYFSFKCIPYEEVYTDLLYFPAELKLILYCYLACTNGVNKQLKSLKSNWKSLFYSYTKTFIFWLKAFLMWRFPECKSNNAFLQLFPMGRT